MNTTDPTVEATNTVSLANEEEVKQVLLKSVLGLWDVVNDLTRLRPSRRYRYRVTIFGSARAKAGTFGYEETKRAAAALAEMDCDIITGILYDSTRASDRSAVGANSLDGPMLTGTNWSKAAGYARLSPEMFALADFSIYAASAKSMSAKGCWRGLRSFIGKD
jgi:hypothetical protein